MKPSELLKGINLEHNIYSQDKKIMLSYLNEDCVIAYDLNKIGSIFIIKGKRTNFAFFHLNKILSRHLFNNISCRRITLKEAVKLLGKCNIIDKKAYSKIQKLIILENLK